MQAVLLVWNPGTADVACPSNPSAMTSRLRTGAIEAAMEADGRVTLCDERMMVRQTTQYRYRQCGGNFTS